MYAEKAGSTQLDRITYAVDGAESSHGKNAAMWRPNLTGPQGPMQVGEKAALDVSGGDRFDLVENRAIGRAYLSLLYRRYGNWSDVVTAYNWGMGNVDAWISQRQRNLSLVAEAGPGLHRTFRSQRSASNALPGSDVARPATERSLAADARGQRPSTISLGTEWSVVSDVAAERTAASAHAAKRRVPLTFIENLRSRRTRLFRWATTERLSRSSGSASISKLTCRAAPSSCRNSTTKPHSPQMTDLRSQRGSLTGTHRSTGVTAN